MVPILVLGMPIFDTTLVVFTRLREGRSPFQGGKDHTSHRLVALGLLSHRTAVITLYVVCILLGAAGVAVIAAPQAVGLLIGLIVGIVALRSRLSIWRLSASASKGMQCLFNRSH